MQSHFRRGWAGFQVSAIDEYCSRHTTPRIAVLQFCKVAHDATEQLKVRPALFQLFLENNNQKGNLSTFHRFCKIVSEEGDDPFRIWSHASSWIRGAAELGLPLWFTTVDTVSANPGVLLRLLGAPNATMPSLDLPAQILRRSPVDVPSEAYTLYSSLNERIHEALNGTCVAFGADSSMYAFRCV